MSDKALDNIIEELKKMNDKKMAYSIHYGIYPRRWKLSGWTA